MVLKFYIEHDQTAMLQKDQIQISFYFRTTWYIWLKYCMEHQWAMTSATVEVQCRCDNAFRGILVVIWCLLKHV